jgi:hypothetical protein
LLTKSTSGSGTGLTTVARMLRKLMLRTTPGGSGGLPARCGPRPIEMGPVTLVITRFENAMSSNLALPSHRILMGQP